MCVKNGIELLISAKGNSYTIYNGYYWFRYLQESVQVSTPKRTKNFYSLLLLDI